MGSSYPTVAGDSSARSSSDSLNGLKFGQKIYFGDVTLPVSPSSSAAVGTPPGKKGRGSVQTGQPPRCQVEGCDIDLTDAKAYYSRHKVCCMHSKSSKVTVAGIEQRFCQQCSRFHQLGEFDHGKRSCRRRLAGHNERRRKPPPGSLLSTRLGRLSPSVFDGGSSSNGFLVDFSASLKAPGGSSWPGNHSNPQAATGMFFQSSVGGTNNYQVGPTIPSGECFAGVTESTCALSLLSNQDWSSGNRAPCIGPSNPLNPRGSSIGQSSGHFSDNSWGLGHSLNSMPPNLGLGQLPHPLPSRASDDELDMVQSGGTTRRQLVEIEQSSGYGPSADHMHWLL